MRLRKAKEILITEDKKILHSQKTLKRDGYKFGFIGGNLLSLEKESSKEISKKTKISKRQKPTL